MAKIHSICLFMVVILSGCYTRISYQADGVTFKTPPLIGVQASVEYYENGKVKSASVGREKSSIGALGKDLIDKGAYIAGQRAGRNEGDDYNFQIGE